MEALTTESIENAINSNGITHPVIKLIDSHASQMSQFLEGYHADMSNAERQTYVKQNYGFFADAVVELKDFSLEPLEIIAIWSKVEELEMPKYVTAMVLASAYAQAKFTNESWKDTTRYMLENGTVPESVSHLKQDIEIYKERVKQVHDNINLIDQYRLQFYPAQNMETLSKVLQLEDKNKSSPNLEVPCGDFLGRLRENWANGLAMIYMMFRPRTQS